MTDMEELKRSLKKSPECYLPVLDYLEAGVRDFAGIAERTWFTEDEVMGIACEVERKGLESMRRHYEILAMAES